jgi:hypothetical protein
MTEKVLWPSFVASLTQNQSFSNDACVNKQKKIQSNYNFWSERKSKFWILYMSLSIIVTLCCLFCGQFHQYLMSHFSKFAYIRDSLPISFGQKLKYKLLNKFKLFLPKIFHILNYGLNLKCVKFVKL